MSDKEHLPIRHRMPVVKRVSGRFFPDGTNAIDNAQNKGSGFTVQRTGVGTYAVTMDGVYAHLLTADVNIISDAESVYLTRITSAVDGLSAPASLTLVTLEASGDEGPHPVDLDAGASVTFSADYSDLGRL